MSNEKMFEAIGRTPYTTHAEDHDCTECQLRRITQRSVRESLALREKVASLETTLVTEREVIAGLFQEREKLVREGQELRDIVENSKNSAELQAAQERALDFQKRHEALLTRYEALHDQRFAEARRVDSLSSVHLAETEKRRAEEYEKRVRWERHSISRGDQWEASENALAQMKKERDAMRAEVTELLKRRVSDCLTMTTLYGIDINHYAKFLDEISKNTRIAAQKVLEQISELTLSKTELTASLESERKWTREIIKERDCARSELKTHKCYGFCGACRENIERVGILRDELNKLREGATKTPLSPLGQDRTRSIQAMEKAGKISPEESSRLRGRIEENSHAMDPRFVVEALAEESELCGRTFQVGVGGCFGGNQSDCILRRGHPGTCSDGVNQDKTMAPVLTTSRIKLMEDCGVILGSEAAQMRAALEKEDYSALILRVGHIIRAAHALCTALRLFAVKSSSFNEREVWSRVEDLEAMLILQDEKSGDAWMAAVHKKPSGRER